MKTIMGKNQFVILSLLLAQLIQSCKESGSNIHSFVKSSIPGSYDMRSNLLPPRLTIAMWDFSWLNMHYPGGAFEDFDKVGLQYD